jgi:hypothetical protein
MKPPALHRRDQAGSGRCFPLHVTDASASLGAATESEQDSELKSSDSGAEAEDIPGT